MELATGLRQWRRCFQRAQEIEATLPDGTLMVHGLEPGAALLGRLDAQSAFRVASARSELKIDERPDHDNMWAYSQVLLAEAETLHLVGEQSSTMTPTPTKPQVKQLGLAASPPKTSQQGGAVGVCRYWGTEAGCKYGRLCKFEHHQLPDRNKRCFLCSSALHQKAQCPTKGASLPVSAGGSEKDKEKDKEKEKGKGKGKGHGKGKDSNETLSTKGNGGVPTINKAVTEENGSGTGVPASEEGKPKEVQDHNGASQTTAPGTTGETLMNA